MEVAIRPYQDADAPAVAELLSQLQGIVADVDPLKQFFARDAFDGAAYMRSQLEYTDEHDGVVYVAESGNAVRGVIFGWIHYPNADAPVIDMEPRTYGYGSHRAVARWSWSRRRGWSSIGTIAESSRIRRGQRILHQ